MDIYTIKVKGDKPKHTEEPFEAIRFAKDQAKQIKEKVTSYLNGNPFACVDRRGILMAA